MFCLSFRCRFSRVTHAAANRSGRRQRGHKAYVSGREPAVGARVSSLPGPMPGPMPGLMSGLMSGGCRRAMTLLEIMLAAVIMAMLLGPFLSNLVSQAKISEETEKLQMALKILQSIKEECMSVRFKDFIMFGEKHEPDDNGFYNLDDMFFPHSRDEVISFQKKYRDFQVSGNFKFIKRKDRDPDNKTVIYVKLLVVWFQPGAGEKNREMSYLIVDPRI